MSWNYRLMREKTPDGYWYGIFTVYYDKQGAPNGHSKTEAGVVGESIEVLRDCLEKFKLALDKPVLEWSKEEGYREV